MIKKTILKNGQLLDIKNNFNRDKLDILIEDGVIKKIAKNIEEKDSKIIDVENAIISPGFIDIHVHCYPNNTVIGLFPDDVGIKKGVTTIIDAGTSGADTIEDFYDSIIKNSKTRVFVNLNIASRGLENLSELSDMNNIEEDKINEVLKKFSDIIVGLKMRASASVVKENGIRPILVGKKIAERLNLPVMIHIGNEPPKVEKVLNILGKGDIVTHCYHGKPSSLIRNGEIIKEAREALKRGVYYDIGHGTDSFSLDIAAQGLHIGLEAETISTDMYEKNIEQPVGSLENTINKMLFLGMPLEKCIEKVTTNPAKIFKLKKLGELKEGYMGDLTIFNIIKNRNLELIDSEKKKIIATKYMKTKYIFIKDELISI